MQQLLRVTLVVLGAIGAVSVPALAQTSTLPPACTNFSDDPIQPGITIVRAQPIVELRACIDALRAQVSLAATTWTDSALQPQQTWIRAVHLVEMRTSLAEVFGARGLSSPAYTDATLTAQTTIVRAVHVTEIRNAILVVAGVCPPAGCNEVIEYYHVDAVGSVRAVTDETGAVILRRDYFPFGEGVAPDAGTSLGFTGQEGDSESGLNYVGARYYRGWTGRFTTVDPVFSSASSPQRWNRYAYALNNPLAYVDPTGLDPCRPGVFCVQIVGQTTSSSWSAWLYSTFFLGWSVPTTDPEPASAGGEQRGQGRSRRTPGQPNPPTPDSPAPNPDPTTSAPATPTVDVSKPESRTDSSKKDTTTSDPANNGRTTGTPGKLPLCISVFARATLDALSPFSPSLSSAGEPLATYFSLRQFNSTLEYAASRPNVLGGQGLLYPFKSSVFRGGLAAARMTAGAAPLLTVDLAIIQGLVVEINAARKGECRAF